MAVTVGGERGGKRCDARQWGRTEIKAVRTSLQEEKDGGEG